MFDSNRNEQNILYKNEFNEWVNTNKNLKIVFAITDEDGEKQSSTSSSWTGERGRIGKEMLTKHLSRLVNHAIFYVCGPPAMLNAMKSILEDKLKITKERIKVEEFTGYKYEEKRKINIFRVIILVSVVQILAKPILPKDIRSIEDGESCSLSFWGSYLGTPFLLIESNWMV
jgi:NAD(P)H-flavin reductase